MTVTRIRTVATILFITGAFFKADDQASVVSASKLARSPKDFYGHTVTVSAEVEDVLGSNMFTLDEDAVLAGPDVLVLVPSGLASTLAHDQRVTVTGEVRPYVQAELERDFDFFKNGKIVDVHKKIDWHTRPVIVADSVRTDTGSEIVQRWERSSRGRAAARCASGVASLRGRRETAAPGFSATTSQRFESDDSGRAATAAYATAGRTVSSYDSSPTSGADPLRPSAACTASKSRRASPSSQVRSARSASRPTSGAEPLSPNSPRTASKSCSASTYAQSDESGSASHATGPHSVVSDPKARTAMSGCIGQPPESRAP
jgi:hypothetical protein